MSDSSSGSGSRPGMSDSSSGSGGRPGMSDSSSPEGGSRSQKPRRPNPRKRRLPDPPDPDDPTRQSAPAPLSGLLEALAARRGWATRLSGAQVHGRWAEIAGPELAAHAEPVRLHGGVLVLRVDTPGWATQVRYLTAELAARANAVLGEGSVTRVTITTGPLQGVDAIG